MKAIWILSIFFWIAGDALGQTTDAPPTREELAQSLLAQADPVKPQKVEPADDNNAESGDEQKDEPRKVESKPAQQKPRKANRNTPKRQPGQRSTKAPRQESAEKNRNRDEQPKRPVAKEPKPKADVEERMPERNMLDDAPGVPPVDFTELNLSGAGVDIQTVGGNQLIITGFSEDLDMVEGFVKRLDQEGPKRELRILTIENKNAADVATNVQSIMAELDPENVLPAEQVTIIAVSNNILLVAAPEERLDHVEDIVSAIDKQIPTIPPQEPMNFQLKYIKAIEAAEKLDELIKAVRAQQGEDPGTEIQIFPNDANNTLIVVAPSEERSKIQMWIDQIDVEPVVGFGELRLAYFPLLESKASELADVLNELLTQEGGGDEAKEVIRRIRMVKSGIDGELEELPPINLERPIKLIADEGTEALICATAVENIEPLRELIDLLDGVPLAVAHGLKLFPLQYADAQTVADMLEDMFQKGKDLTKPAPGSGSSEAVPENNEGEALMYNIGITADIRSNTLIVTGKPKQLDLVDAVLAQIDVASADYKRPLRLIALNNSDATRIATIIEDLWEKRIEELEARDAGAPIVAREKIYLSVDVRTNSLIVSSTPENFDEITSIIETLDRAPEPFVDQIRILNCAKTTAADLKTKIEELWERKASLRNEAELPEDTPVIVADARSNALVIASAQEDYDEIKRLVERLESQELSPIAEIRLVTLKNNDASEIGDMLKQLFEERLEQRLANGQDENPSDRVAVAAEAVTNTLLIAASPENYEEMARLIKALDVEPDLEGKVRVFTLVNAQAEDVSDRIEELFDQGLYTGTVTEDSGGVVEERQKLAIIADARSNAIVVSASKTNLGIIEKLIEQMDTDEAPLIQAEIRLFALNYADALKLTDILDKLFDGMSNSIVNELFKAPTIVPEPRSNTLIVTGTRDSLKRATELIAKLDRESNPPTSIPKVYKLQHAAADSLAEKMQEVFDKRDEGSDTESTPVFILADKATNSLICSAANEDHSMVEHILSLLDVPSTIARNVEVFPLKLAKAEALAQSLDSLFESSGSSSISPSDTINVEPDKRTNSLVVWASRSDMENIRDIINRLDTAEPAKEMMVKVIQLKRAIAEDFSEILDEAINGDSGTGDDAEAVILTYEEQLDDGSLVMRKLLRQDVTIHADQRTNSLFVMAPADSMAVLENLIRSFDQIDPVLAEIRMFPLANADAEEVVERLTDLFEETTTDEGVETTLVTATTAGSAGEGGAPGQKLKFTADRRTNVVIAAGSEPDLNMVEGLIRQLDAQDVEDRLKIVYEAKYVPANEIADAMEAFLEEENDLTSEIEDESAIKRRAERHVTIHGDEESNTVLVGVSPRYYSQTMDLLAAIDRPPPQVLIQVLIAEVTLSDALNLGVEFNAQDLTFSEHAVVGPNNTVQGPDFDVVLGTNLGVGSIGGFNFAISGEDFNFLLQALQSDGSAEVLSRPTILVENNEDANITIGDEVPYVKSSNVSDSGQTNTNIQYEPVGIILDVTPHINPDGYVNLDVKPEISSLNESGVAISEGLTAPTFQKRSADTVVTVKDGETVVIGGLIQTRESESESKMPLFGDIPVIGNLFRTQRMSKTRTELLIILTVDVVHDESDAYAISVQQREESGFLPESVKRSPLMRGLRITPEDAAELSPLGQDRRPVPHKIKPDRPLYGPTPAIYGPQRPGVGNGETASREKEDITASVMHTPSRPVALFDDKGSRK